MPQLPDRPDMRRGRELIERQYADRPQLRPILDAVLALLPTLGPATVQARKTIVSLVSPRRTFAVVRATTKDRADLGLRLDDAEPGGRLQSAKGIGGGGATVRIALRRPQDVDDEVRGLMRRAYEENTAPPAPRRPARRPGAVAGTMTVVIEGSELPGRTCRPEPDGRGHENVYVALGGRSRDRPALAVPGRPGMAIEPARSAQARELHRAAAGGDAGALRRVRQVSEKTTLSTAQLAIAREYGFPSWPKLKDGVLGAERRRAPADGDGQGAPAAVKVPDFLTANAGELIDGQYADRSQLRPILDAVLTVLPALGPVTVQARKTIVSLVSPRRTFAVVQATTRTRVDLGLPGTRPPPAGRCR